MSNIKIATLTPPRYLQIICGSQSTWQPKYPSLLLSSNVEKKISHLNGSATWKVYEEEVTVQRERCSLRKECLDSLINHRVQFLDPPLPAIDSEKGKCKIEYCKGKK